MVIAVTCV